MHNNTQFSGFWGVILGGSSGFGLAAAEKLAAHGMNIAVLYRETANSEKGLKEKLSVLALEFNVQVLPYNMNALEESARGTFITAFSAIMQTKGNVRVLLHSIARGNLKPLVTDAPGGNVLTVEDIQLTTYAMSNSLLDWTRLLLEAGLFCPDARIIGLTSEGANKYWDSYAAISIAKASLESLATYMAVEFAKHGLKTNLVQAGIAETPSLKKIAGSTALLELAKTRNPMGRITRPQDVANVIYLLCMDEASWINGTVIHVDGGEHCR